MIATAGLSLASVALPIAYSSPVPAGRADDEPSIAITGVGGQPALVQDIELSGHHGVASTSTILEGGRRSRSVLMLYNSDGVWRLQQQLVPPNDAEELLFGESVAISAMRCLIGAPVGSPERKCGEIFIYELRDGRWSAAGRLLPSNERESLSFGSSIATSGTTCIVGAVDEEHTEDKSRGSIYIFYRDKDAWTEGPRITPPAGDNVQHFGSYLATDGDYVAVAGQYVRTTGPWRISPVYVYKRLGQDWTLCSTLEEEQTLAGVLPCARPLVVKDGHVIVGGRGEGSSWHVTSYNVNDSSSKPEILVQLDRGQRHDFPMDICLEGDCLAIGAGPSGNGIVLVYQVDSKEQKWELAARFDPAERDSTFGSHMACSNGQLAFAECSSSAGICKLRFASLDSMRTPTDRERIPPPLKRETLAQMAEAELLKALEARASAIHRSASDLDGDTRTRLLREFEWIRERLEELREKTP